MSRTDERSGDKIDIMLTAEFEIFKVSFGQRWQWNLNARDIDPFATFQNAGIEDFDNDSSRPFLDHF